MNKRTKNIHLENLEIENAVNYLERIGLSPSEHIHLDNNKTLFLKDLLKDYILDLIYNEKEEIKLEKERKKNEHISELSKQMEYTNIGSSISMCIGLSAIILFVWKISLLSIVVVFLTSSFLIIFNKDVRKRIKKQIYEIEQKYVEEIEGVE